ncbi:MAG: hypothetical protein HUK40_09305 [Desulfobacter sp.]|nr:hypothetical protein [Desulfobacter sp.]
MGERKKRVFSWILALVFCFVLPAYLSAGHGQFYFVQITDTHLGIKENGVRTKKVVAAINQLPMEIACVVHTGDVYDRIVQGD